MLARLSRQSPARLIALGFAWTILVGSLLLYLPCSIRSNVSITYMDALYTAASSVCVTGLAVVDARDTFSPFGQTVMAILIQIGGLGVTAMGAGVMIAAGKKVNLKGRNLIKEAMNLMGLQAGHFRMPMYPMAPENLGRLKRIMREAGLPVQEDAE